MNESFPIEFYGGSMDGAQIDGTQAPEAFVVKGANGVREIYARQSEQPPFIYVQVGYSENESWK